MRFECRQCGKCCGPKWGGDYSYSAAVVLEEDQPRIAEYLNMELSELKEKYQINGTHINISHTVCTFLENNRCTIHPVKPKACVMWPNINAVKKPGGAEKWAKYCPGIILD